MPDQSNLKGDFLDYPLAKDGMHRTLMAKIPETIRIEKMPPTIFDGKFSLGKPPKPLKPKPFQKILNTIPMPMRIKNIPFKPVGEPRGR